PGNSESVHTIDFPEAHLWSPDHPDLYHLTLTWNDDSGHTDIAKTHFGFRWFDVRDIEGDRQFFLNNKRIVLRTSISWGFWPVNGIFPTPRLAEKQVRTARQLGLNMLNFHRAIGQPVIMDKADALGLLYYEEPGGYAVGNSDFVKKWQRIRLERMVKRDRNHPSLIIYNMRNEPGHDPDSSVFADLADIHNIDETRYKTWASNYYPSNFHGGHAPFDSSLSKLYMEPYNHDFHFQGWWDEHHAGGPGVYRDDYYNSPGNYYRYTTHKSEIIFYGEEGAIGTPPRLEKIASEIHSSGNKGWDGDDYLDEYTAYDRFLDDYGFRKAFPTVDDLTLSMGNVAYYYQGRIIENVRINNITDGYAVNGWEENKIENHSGVVDAYRNPKGDPGLIAWYNEPLYLAVKARKKVLASAGHSVVDVYIVNEKDVNGTFDLEITAENNGDEYFSAHYPVKVSGGNTYGELLKPAIRLPLPHDGRTTVHAFLTNRADSIITRGKEELFTVNTCPEKPGFNVTCFDSSGFVRKYLAEYGIDNPLEYSGKGAPEGRILVAGNASPIEEYEVRQELLDWVSRGNTLLIIGNAPVWMDYLASKEVADYRGVEDLGILWYGGNHFVRDHRLFDGLPVNTVFNWEYQCFASYDRHRQGLRVRNGDIIVGAVSDHKKEVYSALGIINHGKGRIIYSSLDFEGALDAGDDASSVAKRLVYNMLVDSHRY
ncbi:MAG TPA: glycoside hydrolase family 2 TIM barrel-domain containing protein, partial [Bacteroidales bacterium]|nr:glycoside hydrolase family 2 TIM barrel-domain containing protein [Bacteroidales bacterium]